MSDFFENEQEDGEFINNNVEKKNNRPYIYLAILLFFILTVLGIYLWFNKNDKNDISDDQTINNEMPAVSTNEQEMKNDSIEDRQDSLDTPQFDTEDIDSNQNTLQQNESTNNVSNEDSITANDAVSEQLVYFIISGAFSDEANANKQLEQLKQEGYQAIIVGKNTNGLTMVAYEGFVNFNDALNRMNEIRNTNPSVWIYKKTLR